MADGSTTPVGEVTVGDEVIATDPQTGKSGAKPVTMLHLHRDTELTDLTVMVSAVTADDAAALRPTGEGAGERSTRGPTVTETVTLHTTAQHPFWDDTLDRWVDAGELEPGHELLVHPDDTADGGAGQGTVTATVTEVDNYTGDALMRDLTIADTHTYHVIAGETPILVHNCGGGVDYRGNPCSCRIADETIAADSTLTLSGMGNRDCQAIGTRTTQFHSTTGTILSSMASTSTPRQTFAGSKVREPDQATISINRSRICGRTSKAPHRMLHDRRLRCSRDI